jgi:hypothetical protein
MDPITHEMLAQLHVEDRLAEADRPRAPRAPRPPVRARGFQWGGLKRLASIAAGSWPAAPIVIRGVRPWVVGVRGAEVSVRPQHPTPLT